MGREAEVIELAYVRQTAGAADKRRDIDGCGFRVETFEPWGEVGDVLDGVRAGLGMPGVVCGGFGGPEEEP